MHWKDHGVNEVLEGKGFYISFRLGSVAPSELADAIGKIVQILGGEGSNYKDETALVCELFPNMVNPYFILNGDFRKDYEGIIDQGWDACYAFWLSQQEDCISEWSHEPLEVVE